MYSRFISRSVATAASLCLAFPALTALTTNHCALAAPQQEPRQKIRFDDGWRFQQESVAALVGAIPVTDWKYRDAEASAEQFAAASADTTAPEWKTAKTGDDTFKGRAGFSWFRTELKSLDAPRVAGKMYQRVIQFTGVDDNAVVYLNGQKLAEHSGWNSPFNVALDSAWKENGPNILAIRVENTAGGGGVTGAVTLGWGERSDVADPSTPDMNDSKWRSVHLPHDYVVEGTFQQTADLSHGYLPASRAWYRKTFTPPADYANKRIWIEFDGVYRDSIVYLNGQEVGRHPCGYTGFRFDITPYLKPGQKNVLSVAVDASRFEGWWYEGGGIYRHVWLHVTDPLHVAPQGIYVTSSVQGIEGTPNSNAGVAIQTQLQNDGKDSATCTLVSTVLDPKGKVVATTQTQQLLSAGQGMTVKQNVLVTKAQLWSIETPQRYTLRTEIQRDGKTVDRTETPFGIRTFRFDPNKGFFLNGKSVKIQGTCNHQDHAGIGVALPDSMFYWRVRKLKEMGSNAYRCSHNPPAPELLDACDKLGMLVMDENRHLGETEDGKASRNTPADTLPELREMILRDRNHPSIILWSMSNEEGIQNTPDGARIFTAMKKVVRELDPTRPITAAMNFGWDAGLGPISDTIGFNYNTGAYDGIHKKFPNIPLYGSETARALSTRGIYANDKERGYVSAYDVNKPSWGNTAEEAWKALGEREWMAGGFVWTGFDYKGEPTPYEWPCINSHFGILDICGFPKDSYYYYKAWWDEKPTVHILPHWNWPGKEGQDVSVWCHSNADEVELFLNGKSLGKKTMPRLGHLEWTVPYAAGRLEAHGYRAGKTIATDVVETTGKPATLQLTTTRKKLTADSEDITVVEVAVRDEQGRIVPDASDTVTFTVTGAGEIAGVGNGDPSSHEPDKASKRQAFNGRCVVLIRAGNATGPITLQATAPGLRSATMALSAATQGDAF